MKTKQEQLFTDSAFKNKILFVACCKATLQSRVVPAPRAGGAVPGLAPPRRLRARPCGRAEAPLAEAAAGGAAQGPVLLRAAAVRRGPRGQGTGHGAGGAGTGPRSPAEPELGAGRGGDGVKRARGCPGWGLLGRVQVVSGGNGKGQAVLCAESGCWGGRAGGHAFREVLCSSLTAGFVLGAFWKQQR